MAVVRWDNARTSVMRTVGYLVPVQRDLVSRHIALSAYELVVLIPYSDIFFDGKSLIIFYLYFTAKRQCPSDVKDIDVIDD